MVRMAAQQHPKTPLSLSRHLRVKPAGSWSCFLATCMPCGHGDILSRCGDAFSCAHRRGVFAHPLRPLQQSYNDVALLTSMADEYDMSGLMKQCEMILMKKSRALEKGPLLKVSVEPDGVLKWTLIAQRYGFTRLLADCENVIIRYGCAVKRWIMLMYIIATHLP